jgi:hypothetical protein
LQIDDPERAALHLMLLVGARDRWYVDDNRADRRDTVARVTYGVSRALLHGYGA